MKQTVWSSRRDSDIAVAIEDDKAVAVFERAPRPRRRSGYGNVKRRLDRCIEFGGTVGKKIRHGGTGRHEGLRD
jgi:hypothetical protein